MNEKDLNNNELNASPKSEQDENKIEDIKPTIEEKEIEFFESTENSDNLISEATDEEQVPSVTENIEETTKCNEEQQAESYSEEESVIVDSKTNNTYESVFDNKNPEQDLAKMQEQFPRKQKTNKIWKGIGFSALALCFGLAGGFIGSGINPNTGSTGIAQQYKLESTTVSAQSPTNLVDVSDIVENTMPSIVSITATVETEYYYGFNIQSYETPSSGSGVIYSQSDDSIFVVTNYHVIAGAKEITVGWIDGTTNIATVEGYSESNDIALLKISLKDINDSTLERLKVAVIGDSDNCKVGEGTIAIGNALGYGQTVTSGIVSALNRSVTFSDGNTMTMMQTNAAINPGNSGGALLNSKGELIGINSAKYSDTSVEGIGYAIPINTVVSVVEDIISGKTTNETATGVTLGITGYDITEQMAQNYNMPIGVCVQFVETDSMAEIYGLLPGDIITAVDGTKITSISELKDYLSKVNVGDTIDLTINRPSNNTYNELIIDVTFK